VNTPKLSPERGFPDLNSIERRRQAATAHSAFNTNDLPPVPIQGFPGEPGTLRLTMK